MQKYQVFFTQTIESRYQVEAGSAHEAEQLARQRMEDGVSPDSSRDDTEISVSQRTIGSTKHK